MDLSVVLPAFNEDKNIKFFIESIKKVDQNIEIIVVDNNSTDNTKKEILKTEAIYVNCKAQGYGIAIRTGLNLCKRKFIAICEPDGTFQANDIKKLYEYTKTFDAVFGTRTNKKYIEKGAKMNFPLRIGNILVAKIIQFLFNTTNISDVGCTLKIIKTKDYLEIKDYLHVVKSEFQPELMINLFLRKKKIIEVPVLYLKRIGYSKITSNYFKTTLLACKMLILIFKLRFKNI